MDLKVNQNDTSPAQLYRWGIMCADLKNMQLTFSGSTILDDNDSDGFVEFEIEPNGKLNVIGHVGGAHEDNYIKFKYQTDQTCIDSFVEDFKSLLDHK